jgi:hypothetical protein
MNITKENYEEFALDFIEGNLNAADQKQFEDFLTAHPAIRRNLDNFELVILPSFAPIMPNKAKLYKDNSKIKPILFYIKNIAALILILILLSVVIIQLNKIPDNTLVQQESLNDKISEELSAKVNSPEQNSEIKISNPDVSAMVSVSKKSPGFANPKNEEIKNMPSLLKMEITKPSEQILSIVPIENEQTRGPDHTMAGIEKIDFRPDILWEYKIDHRPNFLLVEDEELQNDPLSKIGRLLAKANLIPTGLQEEIEEINIREKMIPETYVDFK